MKTSFDARELATVLAGLRAIQDRPYCRAELDAVRSNKGAVLPLSTEEIDELYEEIDAEGTLETRVAEYMAHLETLTLAQSLWWFIENLDSEDSAYSVIYWYLRDRVAREPDGS